MDDIVVFEAVPSCKVKETPQIANGLKKYDAYFKLAVRRDCVQRDGDKPDIHQSKNIKSYLGYCTHEKFIMNNANRIAL